MTDHVETQAGGAEERLRAALRDAIPAAGRHQVTIADELRVTTKHLCAMLTGRARLTLEWAERIAEACGREVVVAVGGPTEPPQCGASNRISFGAMPYIGPCVLRHGHEGPVHQDANGAQWTDPRPATAQDAAALCAPALGNRLADALRQTAHWCDGCCSCEPGTHQVLVTAAENDRVTEVRGAPEALASALLPVVEAETARRQQQAIEAERAAIIEGVKSHFVELDYPLYEDVRTLCERIERGEYSARKEPR